MKFRISIHAHKEMEKRGIPFYLVESVLNNPQQIITQVDQTKSYQSQVDFDNYKIYLLRVIVNDNVDPAVVVTVYKTSKITKYWQTL